MFHFLRHEPEGVCTDGVCRYQKHFDDCMDSTCVIGNDGLGGCEGIDFHFSQALRRSFLLR